MFRDNGFSVISVHLYWYRLEGARGVYYTDILDSVKQICNIASEYDIKVSVVISTLWGDDSLWCTPSYVYDPVSGDNRGLAIVRSDDMRQAFLDMFTFVVQYMAGTPNIAGWHLLNEPWYWGRAWNEHDFVTENGETQKENFITLIEDMANIVRTYDGRPSTVRFVSSKVYNNDQSIKNIFQEDWGWDARIFNALDYIGFNSYLKAIGVPMVEQQKSMLEHNIAGCRSRGKEVWILEFGYGWEGTSDEEQREWYRYNMDWFSTLDIEGALAWHWTSDVAPPGWDQNPAFGGHNLANPDGTGRPAFYEMSTHVNRLFP